jgi:ankyrin repeat protein
MDTLPPKLLLCLGLAMACLCAGCNWEYRSAAVDGDLPFLISELDQGVDANIKVSILGTRLLTLAAAHGHTDLVKALLDRGAVVNARDGTGWTPLHAAAYGGHPEIIRLLLERGAVMPESNWYTPSPLSVAETLNHQAAVDVLKQASASPKPAGTGR